MGQRGASPAVPVTRQSMCGSGVRETSDPRLGAGLQQQADEVDDGGGDGIAGCRS